MGRGGTSLLAGNWWVVAERMRGFFTGKTAAGFILPLRSPGLTSTGDKSTPRLLAYCQLMGFLNGTADAQERLDDIAAT